MNVPRTGGRTMSKVGRVVRCVLLEPTGRYSRALRRYALGQPCPMGGYHATSRSLDVVQPARGLAPTGGDVWTHDDPAWPTVCDCGYLYDAQDAWQVVYRTLLGDEVSGLVYTMEDAPVGAMWYVDWMPAPDKGWDGHAVSLMTPYGQLLLDETRPDGTQRRRIGHPPGCTVVEPLEIVRNGRMLWRAWLREGLLLVED